MSYAPWGMGVYGAEVYAKPPVYSEVSDAEVRMVAGGSPVGADRSLPGIWPVQPETVEYGSVIDAWGGGVTAGQINAGGFGVAIRASITDGEARVEFVGDAEVAYLLPGSPAAETVLVELRVDDATRSRASLNAYRLPADGLQAANDPRVESHVAGAELRLSREYRPNRNVQKVWRSVEFFASLEPETNIPGVEIWASIDDGPEFQLRDESGAPLRVTETGAHEGFMPATVKASGSWIQIIPRIPDLEAGQRRVSVELRDITLHGSWLPKTTDQVRCVVLLDRDVTADPLTGQQGLSRLEVMRRLRRLAGPRHTSPITLFDPEMQEETHCVVTAVDFHRIGEVGEPRYLASLTLRKTPYDAG